jgi:hypothetical protein
MPILSEGGERENRLFCPERSKDRASSLIKSRTAGSKASSHAEKEICHEW